MDKLVMMVSLEVKDDLDAILKTNQLIADSGGQLVNCNYNRVTGLVDVEYSVKDARSTSEIVDQVNSEDFNAINLIGIEFSAIPEFLHLMSRKYPDLKFEFVNYCSSIKLMAYKISRK